MSATLTVEAWLKTVLSDPDITALLPGGVHRDDAPLGTVTPFCVVEFAGDAPDTHFNTQRALTVVFPHVRVVVDDETPTVELLAAFDAIDTALATHPIPSFIWGLPGTISDVKRVSETNGTDHAEQRKLRWLGGSYRVVVGTD